MPFEKGRKKTGGRQKGAVNKVQANAQVLLDSMGCNPIQGMARIAQGDVQCLACSGKKKAICPDCKNGCDGICKACNGKKKIECLNCHGTGSEPISLNLRAAMLKELANYYSPKLSATKIDGSIAVDHELIGLSETDAFLEEIAEGESKGSLSESVPD